jgi:hypothetical protein
VDEPLSPSVSGNAAAGKLFPGRYNRALRALIQ